MQLIARYVQRFCSITSVLCVLPVVTVAHAAGGTDAGRPIQPVTTASNCTAEINLSSTIAYANPFNDVTINAKVTDPNGKETVVPAFWSGGRVWRFRYASSVVGLHRYQVQCSDSRNRGMNSLTGAIRIEKYHGSNALYAHGPVKVDKDRRHFAHADGTPFFWLADTWWKGLSNRISLNGFSELTSDRARKGFSVVQIVCGPYPDEGLFEKRWGNEAGIPYLTRDMSLVNPAYFDIADRKIRALISAGIVPAIVGGWGRGGSLETIGLPGYKRHWRNLIARYGSYPVVWIIGGEAGGPGWTELARFVRMTDPFHRLITMHPASSARSAVTDETVLDFDMLQTGHGDWAAAKGAVPQIQKALAQTPRMPALIGEACYDGHMQSAFQDVERYLFWTSMLSGAAGHTYGAAGVWHVGIEGDPGTTPVYDWTTWREGMNFRGSTEVGLGKQLLQTFHWSHFTPHSEWSASDCFAAGIPEQTRIIYQPRRSVYNWDGTEVYQLERGIPYHVYYVNPTNGRRHDVADIVYAGPTSKPFDGHLMPTIYDQRTATSDRSGWTDYGSESVHRDRFIIGRKGMVTLCNRVSERDLMVSVNASSGAEAGIILRYRDRDNYLVALYSPLLKALYLHDRKNGQWGPQLGRIEIPEIGPDIVLTAAVHGNYAAITLSDGIHSWFTPTMKVNNVATGRAGLWMYQVGDHQDFSNFKISRTPFAPALESAADGACEILGSDRYRTPGVPSPQDWILILERIQNRRQSAKR